MQIKHDSFNVRLVLVFGFAMCLFCRLKQLKVAVWKCGHNKTTKEFRGSVFHVIWINFGNANETLTLNKPN